MLLRDKSFECQIKETRFCFYACSFHTFNVIFHWLLSVDFTTFPFIVIRIALITLPRFDLDGFIRHHGILFGNSSLSSLIVIYASVSCISSTRSTIYNFSTLFVAAKLMSLNFSPFHFLYVLVMLSPNSLLSSFFPIL